MAKKAPHHGKQHVAAIAPGPNKPVRTMPGGVTKGVTHKHAGSHKHKTHAKKHHPSKAKRTLALGEAVGCCSAEALAASLRLAGWPVSDEDVLALYWLTADDPDAGASIWETLAAAARFGLAGVLLDQAEELQPSCGGGLVLGGPARIGDDGDGHFGEVHMASLILGVDLPGPHTVTVDTEGDWWSWGEPYDPAAFPDAVIEEAWKVRWAA